MLKKAKEYHQEAEKLIVRISYTQDDLWCLLSGFREKTEQPLVSLVQLIAQKEKNLARQGDINEKKAKLLAFQGLPPVRSYFLDLITHICLTSLGFKKKYLSPYLVKIERRTWTLLDMSYVSRGKSRQSYSS